jgi:hypothetical protein
MSVDVFAALTRRAELRGGWGRFYPRRAPRWYCRARRWLWRHVRRYDGEICHSCGKPVHLVWWADEALWEEIVGGPGGIRCVLCFSRECWDRRISVAWRPKVDFRA